MPDFVPTPEQRRILDHPPDQHARVLAGPGTGKSATLVALIDQLLAGDPVPRLRLLTFTRAATGELAKKVSAHPAAAAERPSTIHSFSISVLVRNPGAGDLPEPLRIADDWEYEELVRPTLARRAGVTVPRLDRLVREMAANWELLQRAEDPEVEPVERARFHGAWGEHRRIYGYTLLQELPFALRKALRDHPDLEGVAYTLLVVDEYQDLNACDLEVVRLIGDRGCSVIGAGDDDQSIYSWRKAAPEGIRRFLDDYPGAGDYTLSITQRCGANIVDWATYVIAGDLDRPRRPALTPAPGSPPGEVALLSFAGHVAEARGIAALVQKLVHEEGIPPAEVLVLLRGDYRGAFSYPIKQELDRLGVAYSDPDAVDRLLAHPANRRMLAIVRLLVHRDDSLAWATLLHLEPGIGNTFVERIYEIARTGRQPFGAALLAAHAQGFPDVSAAPANRAHALVESTLAWLAAHALPDEVEIGWGLWIIETVGGDVVPAPTEELHELLLALDELTEAEAGLGRFLGQISPLGKDRERNESQGVRIMSMAAAKGLTARATIIAALEEGIVPRPTADLAEERRLLYVAMTRAKEFLYITWARRRTGPTARAGAARVQERRSHCHFLNAGPVASEDGLNYLRGRLGRPLS
jgi:DNA helicase-2/ATP-dependent DNA helicase PcrA